MDDVFGQTQHDELEIPDAFDIHAVPETQPPSSQTLETSEPPVTFAPSPSDIVVPDRGIDPTRPMVALTFDDGPSEHTARIMQLLDEHGGRATFFVIRSRVLHQPSTVIAAHEAGHEVLGHSSTHRNFTNLSREELRREILDPHTAIEDLIGPIPRIFRPPYGLLNSTVRSVASDNGFAVVNWSLDTRDWQSRNAETVHAMVMDNIRDRDIVLAHDIHASTAEAMITVIPELIERGYQLVTLSELMHYAERTLTPGGLYTHGRS
jgi:peptidoglycan/xylan/chitin deacetylase (PgdA/CDA1 family)